MSYFPGGASHKKLHASAGDMRHRFSLLVQKIPWRRAWQLAQVFLSKESHWTEESGGLQFTGSYRVGYDWISSSKEKMSLFYGYSHHPQWFLALRKIRFIHFFSIYLPWSDATRCQDLSFLKVDFTLIKRLFSSSSLSAIRVVSVAYLSFFLYFSCQSWFQLWFSQPGILHDIFCI